MRVLVLGVTGMLGHAVYRSFAEKKTFNVWGTLRHAAMLQYIPSDLHQQLITSVDVLNTEDLLAVLAQIKPHVVINCVGLIKQLSKANDPLAVLPINSLFPHRLAQICRLSNTRLIHISTDCVFSGRKEGIYSETDPSDAEDLYGKSKFIGEVANASHVITLRTSIIGHELNSCHALVDWFLAQKERVNGYVHALYSGLPTCELARVIHDYVIPNESLSGLYHVAAKPINKYELLQLIAEIYQKDIIIAPEETTRINRALDAARFTQQTGYIAPEWPILIQKMHQSKLDFKGDSHVS